MNEQMHECLSKASLQYPGSLKDIVESVLLKPNIWTQTKETSTLHLSEMLAGLSRFG